MQHDMIIAGFGGQGALLIGKMLAYAGMHQGKEVSWLPSYGPEMRGGTANCTVVISDKPVGSPVIKSPRALLALNLPSLDKFEDSVRPGGVILVNTSLVNRPVRRTDLRVVSVAANDIANSLGNPRGANMVALGAFVGATGVVDLREVEALVRDTFARKPALVEVNLKALHAGFEAAGEQVKEAAVTPGSAGPNTAAE
jgi:2-oxoglutarate ferredoxin oxidoreductase subunit gamma